MSNNTGGALMFGVLAILAVAFGYPMAAEDTASPCLALERHVLGAAANLDDGRAAEQTAAKRYPNVPTFLGCTGLYWQGMVEGRG